MSVLRIVIDNMKAIVRQDRRSVLHLLYYSAIDALLALSIPLASAFVINSILAHADISLLVVGIIVIVMFALVTLLQIVKEYIVEKMQQRMFISTAIRIAETVTSLPPDTHSRERARYMNYFFDITAIQKSFPILLLDGVGLIAKVVVSLMLLYAFEPVLFIVGALFFSGYTLLLLLLGRNGIKRAIEHSDAKHQAIYDLQHLHEKQGPRDESLKMFDQNLSQYVLARRRLFRITIRQMALTFFTEGFIFSTFLIAGGYLVIHGTLAVGEFIAAEIVVVSITYALKAVVKHIDYIYDTIEGFYKVDKLSVKLEEEKQHARR